MQDFRNFNTSFIFDFPKEKFITTLHKNNITGIHKCKSTHFNSIEFDDNYRITTNKNFVIEILKKSMDDNEYVYRLLLEDKVYNNPIFEIGENFRELLHFLNGLQ